MAKNNSLFAKKLGGKHMSFTDTALFVCEYLATLDEVTTVSPGVIELAGKLRGNRRVKALIERGSLLLKIRENGTIQQVRVYSKQIDSTISNLKTFLDKHDILM